MKNKMILVTGGAGYIGSHTCIELLQAGFDVLVVDNFSNSCIESLNRVNEITQKNVQFIEGDIRDKALMADVFSQYKIDAVIHFAGLKAVGESCSLPMDYYDNDEWDLEKMRSDLKILLEKERFGR